VRDKNAKHISKLGAIDGRRGRKTLLKKGRGEKKKFSLL